MSEPTAEQQERFKWRANERADAAEALAERIRAEYQRFYDFVAESDAALIDAWHFTENARKAGAS